jgi:T-complex protein 1 subunit gamma
LLIRSLPSTAGEVLAEALPYLERNIHPIVIISAFKKALEDAIVTITEISRSVDTDNEDEMMQLVKSSIATKFVSRWSDLMCRLALLAVRTVVKEEEGKTEVDIKRYARVEKVWFFLTKSLI